MSIDQYSVARSHESPHDSMVSFICHIRKPHYSSLRFQCTIRCILIPSASPARRRLSKMARMSAMKAMKASKASKAVRYQAPEAKVHFASGVPKVQKPGRKLKWVAVSAPAYISGGYSPSLVCLIHMHHSLSHTLAHPFIYKSHMQYLDSYIYTSRLAPVTHTAGGSSHKPVVGEPLGHHPKEPKTSWSTKKGMG